MTLNKDDRHHWSGWPGAFCFKCGQHDPNEQALADGLWEMDLDPMNEDPEWLGTDAQLAALKAAMVCPVKGVLEWDADLGQFVLIPPIAPFIVELRPPVLLQETTSEATPGPGTPQSEFCRHCGAGIGEHRRPGEGTCPKCDPDCAGFQGNIRCSCQDIGPPGPRHCPVHG